MTLELADRSITHPKGLVEYIFIKVGNFHFPTDFVVVDFEADPRVLLILGRSFLRTSRALIDVYTGELVLRDENEQITFHVNGTSKHPQKHNNESITSTLPSIEPKDSLIMGDKHLSIFSTEEIVPIPREYEETSRSDKLEDIECKDSYDSNLDKATFLVTPLSDSNKDESLILRDDIEFLLHNDPSTHLKSIASILEGFIEDPPFEENDDLFDLECYYDSEGDVTYLESLRSEDTTHNLSPEVFFDYEPQQLRNEPENEPLITFSPKSDPLHYEFTGELITIPPGIVREHEEYINRMLLLCSNSSSQSPKNFHTIIESLPISTTRIKDSNPHKEEIDIFSGPDDSIPPGIKSDFDSEEDIIDNLLNNDSTRERLTFNIEPDAPVINNVDELNEDE
ncbi:reverse transcriptase domain-containing protein, partial [Tanacetum coccineum]